MAWPMHVWQYQTRQGTHTGWQGLMCCRNRHAHDPLAQLKTGHHKGPHQTQGHQRFPCTPPTVIPSSHRSPQPLHVPVMLRRFVPLPVDHSPGPVCDQPTSGPILEHVPVTAWALNRTFLNQPATRMAAIRTCVYWHPFPLFMCDAYHSRHHGSVSTAGNQHVVP